MKCDLLGKKVRDKILFVCFILFGCLAQPMAQDKVGIAKQLLSVQLSTSPPEHISSVIRFYENCSDADKDAIRTYMVEAIKDSLTANHKQFAINYIDYYRMIANPDDDYLGSLVVTEGRYYYDMMDALKLKDLADFMTRTAALSELDYSTELSELNRMKDEIVLNGEEMTGCWLMYNTNEKVGYPQEIINITKKGFNEYSVSFQDPNLLEAESLGGMLMKLFDIPSKGISDTCYFTRPKELFYFFSSEKLRKGKEALASGLRGMVRSTGNSVIGELARSENFSTQLLGWFGVIGAEGIFNALIDGLAVSKKRWWLREGYATMKNKSQMDIRYTYFIYKMSSQDTELPAPKITNVSSVMYKYPEGCDIAFIDDMSGLITDHLLSKTEAKIYYDKHPEAKKVRKSKKKRLQYNMQQWEKLKEYNQEHK